MKFVLVTRDEQVKEAAQAGISTSDTLLVYEEWTVALDACEGVDLLFVDFLATLENPHKVAGYEKFAQAKMAHPTASHVPLVLVAPPDGYELDSMVGYPDFLFAHLRRPVTEKIFRRATSWV